MNVSGVSLIKFQMRQPDKPQIQSPSGLQGIPQPFSIEVWNKLDVSQKLDAIKTEAWNKLDISQKLGTIKNLLDIEYYNQCKILETIDYNALAKKTIVEYKLKETDDLSKTASELANMLLMKAGGAIRSTCCKPLCKYSAAKYLADNYLNTLDAILNEKRPEITASVLESFKQNFAQEK